MIDQFLVQKLDTNNRILLRECLRNPVWDVVFSVKALDFMDRRKNLMPDPQNKEKIYQDVLDINREEALVNRFQEMRKWLLEQEITGHEGE